MSETPSGSDTQEVKRPRTVRATPAQWARIGVRAEEAGMKISPFVVACALRDESPEPDADACAPTQEGHRLALTARQQGEMHEALMRVDACVRALTQRLPEGEVSVLEALAFVQRCHRQMADERARLKRMDGDCRNNANVTAKCDEVDRTACELRCIRTRGIVRHPRGLTAGRTGG